MLHSTSGTVVPLIRLILERSGIDSDTTSLLFGSLVDLAVLQVLCLFFPGENFCYGGSECGLTMINVTNSTD